MAARLELQLPVTGDWMIDGVGDTAALNLAAVAAAHHRDAIDLVRVDANGRDFQGDPAENTSYFSFGQDVVAPAGGEVVEVHKGMPDSLPGKPDPFVPGNYIVLRHGDFSLYSLLMHLGHGTTVVEAGMQVEQGQKLARCGNSGHSYAPHVSYVLLDDRQTTSYRVGKKVEIPASTPASFSRLSVISSLGIALPKRRLAPKRDTKVRNRA